MGRLIIIVAKFGFVFLAGMCIQDAAFQMHHYSGKVDLKEYSREAMRAKRKEGIRKSSEKENG